MKKELDNKLCADYPEIFRDRNGDKEHTPMCWGFECGDGWYPLIDQLCRMLMSNVYNIRRDIAHIEHELARTDQESWNDWQKNAYHPDQLIKRKAELEEALKQVPIAVQVKEKFGGLRFYVHNASDEHHIYISFAEAMSYRICEECGAMEGTKSYTTGWYKTLCPFHAKEQNYWDADYE